MSSFAEKQKELKEQAAQQAIYEATLKVLVQQSNSSLKIQDIAEAAGIATGTLYNYFKNKVELLTFVDKRLHYMMLDKIKTIADCEMPPDEKIRLLIHENLVFFKEYHLVFDLAEALGTKTKIPAKEKREGLARVYQCIERILIEGIEQGQFRKLEIPLMAKHLFSAIIGVLEIQSWLQDYEMEQEAEELTKFFLSNLTRHPS